MEEKGLLKKAAFTAAIAIVFLVTFPAANFNLYRMPYAEVSYRQYGYTYFSESPIIAQKIIEMKKPDTTLFVWPAEPEIYFYAGIRSMFSLINVLPFYAGYYKKEVDAMLEAVSAEKPGLLVINVNKDTEFGWIADNYDLVMMTRNLVLFSLKKTAKR
jgi:hypothetical protein